MNVNADLAWLDMIDQLEVGTQPSDAMLIADILVVSSGGKVTDIHTYEKGKLVDTKKANPFSLDLI